MPPYNIFFAAKTNERMKMFHVTLMLGACARIIPCFFFLKIHAKLNFSIRAGEQTKEHSKLLIFYLCFVLSFLFLFFCQFHNQIKQGLLAINKHMLLCVQRGFYILLVFCFFFVLLPAIPKGKYIYI